MAEGGVGGLVGQVAEIAGGLRHDIAPPVVMVERGDILVQGIK
jgi:hypothetical protein